MYHFLWADKASRKQKRPKAMPVSFTVEFWGPWAFFEVVHLLSSPSHMYLNVNYCSASGLPAMVKRTSNSHELAKLSLRLVCSLELFCSFWWLFLEINTENRCWEMKSFHTFDGNFFRNKIWWQRMFLFSPLFKNVLTLA